MLKQLALALCAASVSPQTDFPATPELLVEGRFEGAEGIAFNGEGKMFVTADLALWEVSPEGETTKVADGLYTTVGVAGIGERDIVIADFGPTNAFQHGPNGDGMVWRVTPGEPKRMFATGIGDPNFILVRSDGSMWVSDDGTNEIYLVDADGNTELWTRGVGYPNGLALSPDGRDLYVAQIFSTLDPITFDDRLWRLPLTGSGHLEPELLFETGGAGGNDGLAMDEQGRIYVAENRGGRIWRVDPTGGDPVLVAEGVMNAGSLAFGEGAFDPESLYVTQVRGGRIWRIAVGVRGLPLER